MKDRKYYEQLEKKYLDLGMNDAADIIRQAHLGKKRSKQLSIGDFKNK
jgi:hypothetical protein